ncbi:MAG: YraN family protein [Actinomycetes bacterium]
MTSQRQSLGAWGETMAATWYEAHGYEVVARNWRCRDGEIDLIVRNGETIVFCEVKTRTSAAFGSPAEAVTRTKQVRLRRLASRWLEQSTVPRRSVRFDVASILAGELTMIESAF